MNIGIRIKRVAAGLASACLLASTIVVPTVSAQTFKDVSPDRWSYEYVEALVEGGEVTPADYYRPEDGLNRAELVKLAVTATTGVSPELPTTPTFEDVPADAWYFPYVETAVKYQILEGYRDASGHLTGKFGPGDDVNRAAATKILVNAFGIESADAACENPFTDVKASDWYYSYTQSAYWNSIVSGYKDAAGNATGKFGPADLVTREQAAKMVVNAKNPNPMTCEEEDDDNNPDDTNNDEDDDTDDEDDDDDENNAEPGVGDLEISINEDELLDGGDIPGNATRINYLPLTLSADEDVEVSVLYISRTGLGDREDFDEVWAENLEGDVLSTSASINSSDVAKVKFSSPLEIDAGESADINIVASMATDSTSGNNNALELRSANDVVSTAATVSGDFSLQGPTFRVTNYTVAEIEVTLSGSDRTVEVGDLQTELGRFKAKNEGGSSDKDVFLKRITLKQTGTLDNDYIGNLALYIGSQRVSEIVEQGSASSKYITFKFLDEGVSLGNDLVAGDYLIENNNSRTFVIKGDVLGTDSSADTSIQFELDEADRDFIAEEVSTGYGAKITPNSLSLSKITVKAGDFNISRHSSSPSSRNYPPGRDDVELLIAKVTTSDSLKIEEMSPQLQFSFGSGLDDAAEQTVEISDIVDNLRLIQVWPDGTEEIASEVTMTSDTVAAKIVEEGGVAGADSLNLNVEMKEDFIIPNTSTLDGEFLWKFVIDIQDEGADEDFGGTSVKLVFDNSDIDGNVEYEESGDSVDANQTKGSAEGSDVTISSASLDCTRTDGFSAEKAVLGASDVLFIEFACSNGDSGDVTVTDMSFDFESGDGFIGLANIDSVILKVEDSAIAGAQVATNYTRIGSMEEPSTTTGELTISNFELDIPNSEDVKFRLYGAIPSSADDDIDKGNDAVQAKLIAITANDKDGDTLDADKITSDNTQISTTHPLEGIAYEIIKSGLLTEDISGDTPDADVLVAGTGDVEVATFKVTAIDDNISIDRLYLSNLDRDGAKEEDDATTSGRVSRFKIYGPTKDTVASTLVATSNESLDSAFNSNGNIDFDLDDSNRIYVEKGKSVKIHVKADINQISSAGETGKLLNLAWASIEAISESNGNNVAQIRVADDSFGNIDVATVCWDLNDDGDYEDTGETANAVTDDGDNDGILIVTNSTKRLPAAGASVVGDNGAGACATGVATVVSGTNSAETFTIRNSKPTLTVENLGVTYLVHGDNKKVMKFKVTADDNDSVYLKRFTVDANFDGAVAETGTWKLYDSADDEVPATYAYDRDGDLSFDDEANGRTVNGEGEGYKGTFKVRVTLTTEEEISSSEVYELRVDIEDEYNEFGNATEKDNDAVSMSFADESEGEDVSAADGIQNTGTYDAIDDADDYNLYIWSDGADPNHSATTADWTNFYNITVPTTVTTQYRS